MLLVLDDAELIKNHRRLYKCQCDCGELTHVRGWSLRSGATVSCGCKQRTGTARTHGMRYSNEYRSWRHMKDRCLNPKDEHYKDYGGRGITICQEWIDSFEAFFRDMGLRPSIEYTLDRIDVNGNYEPDNCRWATRQEQVTNKRNSRKILYKGEIRVIAEWARLYGIPESTLRDRLDKGLAMEYALIRTNNESPKLNIEAD